MAATKAPEIGSTQHTVRRILYFQLRLRLPALINAQLLTRGEVLPTKVQGDRFAESERHSVDGKAGAYTLDLRAPVRRKCIRIEDVEVYFCGYEHWLMRAGVFSTPYDVAHSIQVGLRKNVDWSLQGCRQRDRRRGAFPCGIANSHVVLELSRQFIGVTGDIQIWLIG